MGLLILLDDVLRHAKKALLVALIVVSVAGATAQAILFSVRLGLPALPVLAVVHGFVIAATAVCALVSKRGRRSRPNPSSLPPMKRWIVDPGAPNGLREVQAKGVRE